VYNTSIVFDRKGDELARYSKIHLFDAILPDGLEYKESAAFAPGNEVVCCDCDGVRFGLAICYDVRFPELFHALVDMGAQVFLVPAAFTIPTGITQWEPCLRARAIENGCYAAGCGQWGRYARGRENYGHSMVVDPWGTVIAQCSEGTGTLTADLDLAYLDSVRERLPIQKHRRRDLFG
jgi:nitrilase